MPSGARELLIRTSEEKEEYLWHGAITREDRKRASRIFPK
jgi:hypothetical protein